MKEIEYIEICPRDGFQNVKEFIPTEVKKTIIDKLVASGFKKIQVTSFMSPKAIPQMIDSEEIARYALEKHPHVNFYALVPNIKGMERAVSTGLKEVSYVISVSESHNKANVNRSVAESFTELKEIMTSFPGVRINLDIATAFGCPFEGVTSLKKLLAYAETAYALGIRTFDVCDTIGIAYPAQVKEYIGALIKKFPEAEFGIHIHDTRNMGMINSYLALEAGCSRVSTVCGGLGGCPFAPGASGNTASEDFYYMLEKEGWNTGINTSILIDTAKYIKKVIPTGNFSSHFINISSEVCAR